MFVGDVGGTGQHELAYLRAELVGESFLSLLVCQAILKWLLHALVLTTGASHN